jgi:hypothetical protein
MSLRRRILGPIILLLLAVGLGLGLALGLGIGPELGAGLPWAGRSSGPDASKEPEPSWEAIVEATQAQQWPRVEQLLRDWIDRGKDDGKARVMLGQMLASTNRQAEAARLLAGVDREDPS